MSSELFGKKRRSVLRNVRNSANEPVKPAATRTLSGAEIYKARVWSSRYE